MYSISKRHQCVFLTLSKKKSGIGFIVDVLCGNFTYLLNLYSAVELHTNIVLIHFGRQSYSTVCVSNDTVMFLPF